MKRFNWRDFLAVVLTAGALSVVFINTPGTDYVPESDNIQHE